MAVMRSPGQVTWCHNLHHVQVGASTGVTARAAWRCDKRTTLHTSARLSLAGGPSQVELGGRYRWGRLTSTGLAVAYSTQVGTFHSCLPRCLLCFYVLTCAAAAVIVTPGLGQQTDRICISMPELPC